jgi:hypothetical protein
MKIKAKEQFGTRRLNIEENTLECAAKLPNFSDGAVEIDFSGCILDYPATSLLCDEILKRLRLAPEPRQVKFVFDIDFAERVFLKSFFFGSNLLNLQGEKATEEEIKSNLRDALLSMGAKLTIEIIDPDQSSNSPTQAFTYGS